MTPGLGVGDTVVRLALTCWSVDPDHRMTPSQHAWLTTRLKEHSPLTPEERERVRAPLLAWCRRLGGERLVAVIVQQYENTST